MAAVANGIDPNVYEALINQESGGNPNAYNSGSGARGIAQIMPATAANPGYGVQPVDPSDPSDSLRFGAQYLKAMLDNVGGDYGKALAAYNGGLGNVLNGNYANPNWGGYGENSNYVSTILGNAQQSTGGGGGKLMSVLNPNTGFRTEGDDPANGDWQPDPSVGDYGTGSSSVTVGGTPDPSKDPTKPEFYAVTAQTPPWAKAGYPDFATWSKAVGAQKAADTAFKEAEAARAERQGDPNAVRRSQSITDPSQIAVENRNAAVNEARQRADAAHNAGMLALKQGDSAEAQRQFDLSHSESVRAHNMSFTETQSRLGFDAYKNAQDISSNPRNFMQNFYNHRGEAPPSDSANYANTNQSQSATAGPFTGYLPGFLKQFDGVTGMSGGNTGTPATGSVTPQAEMPKAPPPNFLGMIGNPQTAGAQVAGAQANPVAMPTGTNADTQPFFNRLQQEGVVKPSTTPAFAKPGSITISTPHFLVDALTGHKTALAGEAGPETISFSGKAIKDPNDPDANYVNPDGQQPPPTPNPPDPFQPTDAPITGPTAGSGYIPPFQPQDAPITGPTAGSGYTPTSPTGSPVGSDAPITGPTPGSNYLPPENPISATNALNKPAAPAYAPPPPPPSPSNNNPPGPLPPPANTAPAQQPQPAPAQAPAPAPAQQPLQKQSAQRGAVTPQADVAPPNPQPSFQAPIPSFLTGGGGKPASPALNPNINPSFSDTSPEYDSFTKGINEGQGGVNAFDGSHQNAAGVPGQNPLKDLLARGKLPPFLQRAFDQYRGNAANGTNVPQQTNLPRGVPLLSKLAYSQLAPSELEAFKSYLSAYGVEPKDYEQMVEDASPHPEQSGRYRAPKFDYNAQ